MCFSGTLSGFSLCSSASSAVNQIAWLVKYGPIIANYVNQATGFVWSVGRYSSHDSQFTYKEYRMQTTIRRALIVIDVQNDYIGGKLPITWPPVEQSLANIGRAMDAARAANIPVVAVQNILPEGAPFMAKGTPGAELHPTVASRGWDHYVLKNMPSAFCKTDLEAWLQEHQITTLTISGYMTHNCALSTAIAAMHRGFQVEFLSDATGSLPYANRAGSATAEEIHRVMTVVLQARFAAVITTEEWLQSIASGSEPERDTIFASHQHAIKGV
jgi:nicotinamidase-related amidase